MVDYSGIELAYAKLAMELAKQNNNKDFDFGQYQTDPKILDLLAQYCYPSALGDAVSVTADKIPISTDNTQKSKVVPDIAPKECNQCHYTVWDYVSNHPSPDSGEVFTCIECFYSDILDNVEAERDNALLTIQALREAFHKILNLTQPAQNDWTANAAIMILAEEALNFTKDFKPPKTK